MSKNYRGRLFRFFATDVNWLVRGLWKMAHRFVDEFTKQKLLIFGDDYRPKLLELVDANSLEEKYGGKLPNKTDNFWPPQLNWRCVFLKEVNYKVHFPFTRSSFASLILVAKKVEPPLSGWLLNIALRCAASILSCSVVSLKSLSHHELTSLPI